MDARERVKLHSTSEIRWQDVFPTLDGEMMREAQVHFCRYLELASEIVEARSAVDHAIDIPEPISTIKERSNPNNTN